MNKKYIYQWLCINREINQKITFHNFTNCNILDDVSINGNNIIRVHATTFLGLYIHENLTLKGHIFYIYNKLSKCIAITYHARPLLHQSALRNLYCAVILPYIQHCANGWGNIYHASLLPLFINFFYHNYM